MFLLKERVPHNGCSLLCLFMQGGPYVRMKTQSPMRMKNNAATLFLLALVAVSCSNDEKAVRTAAQAYLDATANYDFDAAANYATDETRDVTLKFFSEVIMPATDTAFIAASKPATVDITAVDRLSDTTAEVRFVKTTPLKTDSSALPMLKRNGEWRAHVVIEIPPYFQKQRRDDIPVDELKIKE